jgi:hypothetical protein
MIDHRRLQACLAALPAHEAQAVKQRLDRLRDDCGCHIGALTMMTVTISWIVYAVLVPVAGRSWQRSTVVGLLVLSGSALAGKLLGLGLARVQLHVALRRLYRRADGPSPMAVMARYGPR